MSHTTTIGSIIISDVQALNAAITELKAEGVNCDLLEGVKARAYYADQKGMENPDFTIKLHDGKYDVGLYKTSDGKGYEAKADFYAGNIERILGVQAGEGDDPYQAKMGKLYQKYAIHAATRKAVQQGMTVNRINNADGTVQLRVAV
jgi:pyridoxine 5'-phosphate synthase PdxJ